MTKGPQTNNHLKGWDNRLRQIGGKSHPNIFEYVEVFQREQVSTEVSVQHLAAGALPPRRKKKAIEKDQPKERFSSNIIFFIRLCSRHVSTH